MSCPDARTLYALLDGDLEGAAASRARAHVDACEACGARFRRMASLEAALVERPLPALPESLAARIASGVGALTAPREAPQPFAAPLLRRKALAIQAAAAAVALAIAGLSGALDVGPFAAAAKVAFALPAPKAVGAVRQAPLPGDPWDLLGAVEAPLPALARAEPPRPAVRARLLAGLPEPSALGAAAAVAALAAAGAALNLAIVRAARPRARA